MAGNKHVKPSEDMTDEDYFMLTIADNNPTSASLRYLYSLTQKREQ